MLTDPFGRKIRKLRLSLLESCNFRCQYCMPLRAKFMPAQEWLSVGEIVHICSVLKKQGIEEIRLTGGEPTLRPELIEICEKLSDLNFRKLAMTSNGYKLGPLLDTLRNTACQHINISLDSLNAENFKRIARFDGFHQTINTIKKAIDLGFIVKINTVLMRGLNDHEILDFVNFARSYSVEVRFLELMNIGEACNLGHNAFMSADETIAKIREVEEMIPLVAGHDAKDSTSFSYSTQDQVKISFIAPVTKSFCGNCSRWRLTANGFLRACLMSEVGVSLRHKSDVEIAATCQQVLKMKPLFGGNATTDRMHTIGG